MCRNLTEIKIPDSVDTIRADTFYGCESLTSISIPASVKAIGGTAFCKCKNLSTINYGSTKSDWEKVAKYSDWDKDTGSYTVQCTNGTAKK